jgi:hypothetical protein
MDGNLTILVLLAGLAFLLGVMLTLLVCDRSLKIREKRQALRERELAEVSRFVDKKLDRLADRELRTRSKRPQ